ncbi:MAG: Fic family protein [Kofleriaceae bacterium]|nr:Fic family protein [Kofleriaceae bacterium]
MKHAIISQMVKPLDIYKRIGSLRARFYEASSGKEALLQMIADVEIADEVFNSNAIENSTLTLEDTEKVLLQIELDRYISERELFEARNLARVVEYVDKNSSGQRLALDTMCLLHKLLLSNIRDDIAGRFRNEEEWVRVGNHIAAAPNLVAGLLTKMLSQYHANPMLSIAKRIATFHLRFESIHPFVDGNGRIGRVLNNYLLLREGYVPINIRFASRDAYYEAFREFNTSEGTLLMEEIIGKALTNSYHKRLAYLDGKEIIKLSEYAKRKGVSHSNLINKAHRQTIEAFWEKGIWKMGY